MKNIHILPTDKPSRLQLQMNGKYHLENGQIIALKSFQNIYITNDSEIKEGDWYLIEFNGLKITQCTSTEELISIEGRNDCKKIILTTDQDLTKNGVQAIDDEFLEWFVKNPSCEEIKTEIVEYGFDEVPICIYEIITPQEEPKQEQDKNKYSEEDMKKYADYCIKLSNENRYYYPLRPEDWFEQFSKFKKD
jgi:hypothetical protein